LQARMLKISAGNEEFGLCGKWLLHGFKIAKLHLQGNPGLMQRSQLVIWKRICNLYNPALHLGGSSDVQKQAGGQSI
jgi:hypothetical protein